MKQLMAAIRHFNTQRQWEKFHSPKNLAMALSVEVAELVEPFQWLTPSQSRHLDADVKQKVAEEIGDVLIYLCNLADQLDIEPLTAAHDKLAKNRQRYPVAHARGRVVKPLTPR